MNEHPEQNPDQPGRARVILAALAAALVALAIPGVGALAANGNSGSSGSASPSQTTEQGESVQSQGRPSQSEAPNRDDCPKRGGGGGNSDMQDAPSSTSETPAPSIDV
jgi:hypothetical protein